MLKAMADTYLQDKLYEIIKDLFKYHPPPISEEYSQDFIDQIVNRCGQLPSWNIQTQTDPGIFVFYGFPEGDLIKQISKLFIIWGEIGEFPINFVGIQGLTDCTESVVVQLNRITPNIMQMCTLLGEVGTGQGISPREKIAQITKNILGALGPRGLLTCMGIRKTTGSSDRLPPTRSELVQLFNQPIQQIIEEKKGAGHSSNTILTRLTVGGRALVKHAHRSSEVFWGVIKGTEEAINKNANIMLNKLLNECVWVNVHWLPHDQYTLEVRIAKGYGARWQIGGKFRGFLEPQIEHGHQCKWRH